MSDIYFVMLLGYEEFFGGLVCGKIKHEKRYYFIYAKHNTPITFFEGEKLVYK